MPAWATGVAGAIKPIARLGYHDRLRSQHDHQHQNRPGQGPARHWRGRSRIAPLTGEANSLATWGMLGLVAPEQNEPPSLLGDRGSDQAFRNADGTAHWLGDGPRMKALQHGPLHRRLWPPSTMPWRILMGSHAPSGARPARGWRNMASGKKAACPGQERGGRDCRPALAFWLTLHVLRSHPLAPLRTADIEVQVSSLPIRSCKAQAFPRPTRTSTAAL
jgi:hypothetical protein